MTERAAVYAGVIAPSVLFSLLIWFNVLDETFFSYTQVYYDEIGNPLNPTEKLFIEIKMRSTTFSANTPMKAEVFLFLNPNYRNTQDYNTNASQMYHVLFDNTICAGEQFGDLPYRCTLWLPRSPNNPIIYYNTTTLTYSHGGEFDVRLDGIGHSEQQTVGHGFIGIAPTETLNEYRTFKMSFIIAIIAAAFAALSVYEQRKSHDQNNSSGWFAW